MLFLFLFLSFSFSFSFSLSFLLSHFRPLSLSVVSAILCLPASDESYGAWCCRAVAFLARRQPIGRPAGSLPRPGTAAGRQKGSIPLPALYCSAPALYSSASALYSSAPALHSSTAIRYHRADFDISRAPAVALPSVGIFSPPPAPAPPPPPPPPRPEQHDKRNQLSK